MAHSIDSLLEAAQKKLIGVLNDVQNKSSQTAEFIQNSSIVSVSALNKGATSALNAIHKGTSASISAIEMATEIKGNPLSILNGVFGDTLEKQKSKLAIQMQFVQPQASNGKLSIFIHGLCASEDSWNYTDNKTLNYGSQLEKDCGFTPLYVRYNSGLHISTNGQLLAKLISDYIADQKIPVTEIALFGHSLGGLVVRSACYYAKKEKLPWVDKITKIFLIGTPHHGNDYEKLGNITTNILKMVPNLVTYGLALAGNKRSAGIKDLRFAYLRDEDWQDQDPDKLWNNNRHPVPLLEGVHYYVIVGTVAKENDNLFTQYFGDGMVPKHTAEGKSFNKKHSIPFLEPHLKSFKGISHTQLAHSEEVYSQLKCWCQLNQYTNNKRNNKIS